METEGQFPNIYIILNLNLIMEEDEARLRMAAISGAAKAARYKEENKFATEEQVIQHVTDNVEEIIKKIDNPL